MTSALGFKASSPECNEVFRFTTGATPANFLAISMAAEPFDPRICTRVQALVELEHRIPSPPLLYGFSKIGDYTYILFEIHAKVNFEIESL